jgi:hypothetical protein
MKGLQIGAILMFLSSIAIAIAITEAAAEQTSMHPGSLGRRDLVYVL